MRGVRMADTLHFLNRRFISLPPWLGNILVALLVFAACEVGRFLSIRDLYLPISIVWPATGFSLATLLLFGFNSSYIGIFLGNFLNNFIHLHLDSEALIGPFFLASLVALGSLIQALVGGYIMRMFSSKELFLTLHDIFIFLVPAGLLTCIIAPTIGVLSLYAYGVLPLSAIPYTWSVFWVGDSMGVYIFTPLLVVWATKNPETKIPQYFLDTIGIFFAFILLTLFTLILDYPLWHLFVPLAIWVTYRFRMHGAVTAVFLITLTAVATYSMGWGSFHTLAVRNPLFILVSFLETIVATSLVLAAALNEREAALNFIRGDNVSLRAAFQEKNDELSGLYSKMFTKLKFVSALDRLSIQMSKHISMPLTEMGKFITNSIECLKRIRSQFSKEDIKEESAPFFKKHFHFLEESLQNINAFQNQADKIAKIIQEQSVLATRGTELVQKIGINALLEASVLQVKEETAKRYPGFKFEIKEDLDPFVVKILMLPEDLAYALSIYMNQAVEALKAKEHQLIDYTPSLTIKTVYEIDSLKLYIENNGLNDIEKLPKYYAQSFFDYKAPKNTSDEAQGLSLALAHDIIVHVHQGTLEVRFPENRHLQLIIGLPITPES